MRVLFFAVLSLGLSLSTAAGKQNTYLRIVTANKSEPQRNLAGDILDRSSHG